MRSYYAFKDVPGLNACNLASSERPIIVNCAGKTDTNVPFVTDNHLGRDDYYLIYMVKGAMSVLVSGEMLLIEEGTAILFPPHYGYKYIYEGGEPLLYYWVHFTGGYVEQLLSECGMAGREPWYADHLKRGKILDHYHRFYDRFTLSGPFLEKEIACSFEQLLLTIAQTVQSEEKVHPLTKSVEMINMSYEKELKIADLAKLDHLSQSRYITLFREQYDMSPKAYIINLRMLKACELLLTTNMSVKQVGIQVGYDDSFFFSKIFKRHIKVSPQVYRASGGIVDDKINDK